MNIILKFDTFRYLVGRGIKGVKRNRTPVATSVTTMVICILLFGIVTAICMNLRAASRNLASNVSISVFINEDTTDDRIIGISDEIRNNEYTESVIFITEEQAWEEYKRDYFDGKEELAASFKDDNPLTGSGHFDIHIKDLSKQGDYIAFLDAIDGVRQVNQSQQVAMVFTDMNKMIIVFFVSIIVLLAIISVFLIQNAISSSITMRIQEISIMRSIGATEIFIQFPFVVEGIVIGIMGSLIPLVLFYIMYRNIITYISVRFESLNSLLDFVSEKDIFRMLIPASLFMGIGIGLLGSMTIIHRKITKV